MSDGDDNQARLWRLTASVMLDRERREAAASIEQATTEPAQKETENNDS